MEARLKCILVITGILFLIMMVEWWGLARSHEDAHVKINQYMGINSTVSYDYILGVPFPTKTIQLGYLRNMTQTEKDFTEGLHGLNEAFFYQFQIMFVSLFALFILAIVILPLSESRTVIINQ